MRPGGCEDFALRGDGEPSRSKDSSKDSESSCMPDMSANGCGRGTHVIRAILLSDLTIFLFEKEDEGKCLNHLRWRILQFRRSTLVLGMYMDEALRT